MRPVVFLALGLACLPCAVAQAAVAQQTTTPAPAATPNPPAPQPAHPVTDNTVTAQGLATTPLTDLNIKKDQIPPILIDAESHTYDLAGLSSCARIAEQVVAFNKVLGEDLDVQKARGVALTPGTLAKSVVSSVIPFDGVIREISGARAAQARLRLAITAGSERRSFLKGLGVQRGCSYPARPYTVAATAGPHRRARSHAG